jgi:hypothetical protein
MPVHCLMICKASIHRALLASMAIFRTMTYKNNHQLLIDNKSASIGHESINSFMNELPLVSVGERG